MFENKFQVVEGGSWRLTVPQAIPVDIWCSAQRRRKGDARGVCKAGGSRQDVFSDRRKGQSCQGQGGTFWFFSILVFCFLGWALIQVIFLELASYLFLICSYAHLKYVFVCVAKAVLQRELCNMWEFMTQSSVRLPLNPGAEVVGVDVKVRSWNNLLVWQMLSL